VAGDRLTGVVCASAYNQDRVGRGADLRTDLDNERALVGVERCRFAGRRYGDESGSASTENLVSEIRERLRVDAPLLVERRDYRNEHPLGRNVSIEKSVRR